jgi:hypothetical protein
MRKLVVLVLLLLSMTAAAADPKPAAAPAQVAPPAAAKSILLAPTDLHWQAGARPGTWMALAEGDPSKGPAHFYQKYEKGFAGPEHAHTSDHGGWILSGTVIVVVDGVERRLPAGSFYFIQGGKPHTAKCDPAAECIMTVHVRGPWDVVPVATQPATKKR